MSNISGNTVSNPHKLTLLSLRLTRQQREKLNQLGGTLWLRQQIDNAVVKDQTLPSDQAPPPPAAPELSVCQCKNPHGVQCKRKAEFVLKHIINGQSYEFSVCQEHKNAFKQGSLTVSERK